MGGWNEANQAFVGSLDDLRLYRRLLSDAEISDLAGLDPPDTTPPVITLLGANPLTVEVGVGVYSELGASATDDDPLFSGVVTVGGDTVDVDVVGGYVVTYTASDPSGNTTVESRMVDVVDTTAPVVTLNGVSPQTVEVGSLYSELGASATDNDPLFSGVVTVGGDTVDVDVVGGYVVTYTASDPSGNTTVESRTWMWWLLLTSPRR